MSNPSSHPVSPTRAGSRRHQIKRSITDVTSGGKIHRSHREPERERQPHEHRHRHHRHRREHQTDGSVPQSAHPVFGLRHSLDVPRGDPMAAINHIQSRRASTLPKGLDGTTEDQEERLQQEREKALSRAEGLKQSLVDLNAFSTATTRRLDETYYAVLEKMSGLQSTVVALKELAETSRDIYGGFETDSRSLENDIVTQLSAVGRFDEQQKTIESLQSRITDGRQRIQGLSTRVDTVRERIEGWERSDMAWRESTRRRLKLIWTVMVVVTVAVLGLFLGVKYTAEDADLAPADAAEMAAAPNMSSFAPPPFEDDIKTDRTLVWRTPLDDRDRLRAFDEL